MPYASAEVGSNTKTVVKVKDFSLNGRRITEKDSTVGWHNVRINTLWQKIEIGKIALGSEALSAELSGTVKEYASYKIWPIAQTAESIPVALK